MDPVVLTSPQWIEIDNLLFSTWCLLGSVVLFAANMLAGHVMIPSLVASLHLPRIAQKARPFFYGVGFLALGYALIDGYRIIGYSGVLADIWPDYWI